jgi:methylated-DNA-[protein]-cysteine S-methyltransferase
MIYDFFETDVAGTLLMAGDGKWLYHLNYPDGRHPLDIEADWKRNPAPFADLRRQLNAYFAGRRIRFDIAFHAEGTPFQKRVWAAVHEVPYGQVVSYQQIAEQIGNPVAVRAVGAANGRNPIVILIPCHRVIGKNGKLTGYGGGLDRKRRLLRLENTGTF